MWKRHPDRLVVRARSRRRPDHADYHVNRVFFETLQFPKLRDRNHLPVNVETVESLPLRPPRHVGVKTFPRFYQRRENFQWTTFRSGLDLFHNGSHTLLLDRQVAVGTKKWCC